MQTPAAEYCSGPDHVAAHVAVEVSAGAPRRLQPLRDQRRTRAPAEPVGHRRLTRLRPNVHDAIRRREPMAQIIAFPVPPQVHDLEVDLITAVDVAIRDLRDIAERCSEISVREQAEQCRQMLEQAFLAHAD